MRDKFKVSENLKIFINEVIKRRNWKNIDNIDKYLKNHNISTIDNLLYKMKGGKLKLSKKTVDIIKDILKTEYGRLYGGTKEEDCVEYKKRRKNVKKGEKFNNPFTGRNITKGLQADKKIKEDCDNIKVSEPVARPVSKSKIKSKEVHVKKTDIKGIKKKVKVEKLTIQEYDRLLLNFDMLTQNEYLKKEILNHINNKLGESEVAEDLGLLVEEDEDEEKFDEEEFDEEEFDEEDIDGIEEE